MALICKPTSRFWVIADNRNNFLLFSINKITSIKVYWINILNSTKSSLSSIIDFNDGCIILE